MNAHQLDGVTSERLSELLIPLPEALPQAPIIHLDAEEVIAIRHGKLIDARPHSAAPARLYRALSPEGTLVALVELVAHQFKVLRGFKS